MRPSNRIDPLNLEIQAALDGLADGPLQAPAGPELVQEVLAHVGDALRARLTLPRPFRDWIRARTQDEVGQAVSVASEEVGSWALPRTHEDDALPFLLVRRDSMESFQVGVGRWAMEHACAPVAVPGFGPLADELTAFDGRLAAVVTRADAEPLLGDRVRLLSSGGWTSALRDDVGEPVAPVDLPWHEAMEDVAPSDEIVASYIETGALASYVETYASKVPTFAEDLRALVSAAVADQETVDFRARSRFGAKPVGGAPRKTHVPMYRPQLMAASSGSSGAPAPTSVQLGPQIADTFGRLVAEGPKLSLIVIAPPGALQEILFGGTAATPEAFSTTTVKWTAMVAYGDGPFLLRITSADGTVDEQEVTLSTRGEA